MATASATSTAVPQRIVDGRQVELPETWLQEPHAWEFERPETRYRIGFGGTSSGNAGNPGRP
jgi:starch phosphorylase